MAFSNAERQRRFRERQRNSGAHDAYKCKHADEVRKWRAKQKAREELFPEVERNRLRQTMREGVRKRVAEHRHRMRAKATNNSKTDEAFSSSLAYAKATARVKRTLPSTPRRRQAVCKRLFLSECAGSSKSITGISASDEKIQRKSAISATAKNTIIDFYHRTDISRQAPGRKDVTIVRDSDGVKSKVQTRHLTASIKETYSLFCEEYPTLKVGKSKFAELRPKYVQLSNKLPHNVCLCRYHENFINAINSLHNACPEVPAYISSLPESLVCQPATRECWLNNCEDCRDGKQFKLKYNDVLQPLVQLDASWYNWKLDNNHIMKVLEEGCVEELVHHIVDILPQFLEHCFFKREQSKSYNNERQSMLHDCGVYDPSKATIQIDFSENYTCMAQDEIQSAHWNQNQVSLFTVALFYSGSNNSKVIVSDNLIHSKDTVIAYIDQVLQDLPSHITSVSFWSDGPASQFKNRYIFACLPLLAKKHEISLRWNYFATSHGKGPVDGIGGSVKRFVWQKVKQRKCIVTNAKSFVEAAREIPNVHVLEMTSFCINAINNKFCLENIFAQCKAIPGISRFHSVIINDDISIPYLLTKDNLNSSFINSSVGTSTFIEIFAQEWVLVEYENNLYPGEVLEINGTDLKVSVMVAAGKNWKWPEKKDVIFYKRTQLLRKLKKPIPVNSRGHFRFENIEI